MNDLLQLKGVFHQKANPSRPGSPRLSKGKSVKVEHLQSLYGDLLYLYKYWSSNTLLQGALVSVYYIDVIAKSRRISKGFLADSNHKPNQSIVGAKFSRDESPKHIITHYVPVDLIHKTLNNLSLCIQTLNRDYGGEIFGDTIEKLGDKKVKFNDSLLSLSLFLSIIVESYYVGRFGIEEYTEDYQQNALVTIYKTNVPTNRLLNQFGIKLTPGRVMGDTTLLLMPEELLLLKQKAPYLIAMATSDLSKLTKTDFNWIPAQKIEIEKPTNEPIIGVIDTMFTQEVYFSDWVEFVKVVDEEIPLREDDYFHGTAVTSLIVDGPAFNPSLEDGCGRFRVRHFGVASAGQFSSFAIIKAIREIVATNRDIKVWNLSLGSIMEINPNFISPEAAILDEIQFEYDVLFVIAGTNRKPSDPMRSIGAPADSINSIVVNSVDFSNRPASYSRDGLVLSFFNKPDVSYYGGDGAEKIRVCSSAGEAYVTGTSFAAPWITRKVAYLIEKMGLPREVAKALIIDSAAGWDKKEDVSTLIGYGVVPKRIEDIIRSKDAEIKFVLSGVSEKYDTFAYNIPVPLHQDKYPYIAKATLCYFPFCARNQGVDYTTTELDISFGRIKEKIEPINRNAQDVPGNYLREGNARKFYRKWDNVKFIRDPYTLRPQAKKSYENKNWGISIKTKERLEEKYGEDIKFGVVITLKEINGVNRIDEFISQCALKGWLVNRINVENRLDVYNIAEEEIEFE